MSRITQRQLSEQIDTVHTAERARSAWEGQQRRRLTLVGWIIKAMPWMLLMMAVIFFALSAPHTAGVMNLITPVAGSFAPLAWEFGIIIIAAFRERGWRGHGLTAVLYTLLGMSIIINISGGVAFVIAALPEGMVAASELPLPALIAQFGQLPALYQIAFLLAVPVGVMIPIVAKLTGEAVIRLAFGTITLEEHDAEHEWLQVRREVVRAALFEAAISLGAGPTTAGKWAGRVIDQMYPDDGEIRAFSRDSVGEGYMATPQPTNQRETGFLAYAGQRTGDRTGQDSGTMTPSGNAPSHGPLGPRIDRKDSPGRRTVPDSLTKAQVRRWLRDNGDRWQTMSNEAISEEIIGHPRGYKTVQRTLRERGLRR